MIRIRFSVTILLLLLAISYGCKKRQPAANLEATKNSIASTIITPGMNSVGVIEDGRIYVYYLNESMMWVLDKDSQFNIPDGAEGVIAPGMGTIAVLKKGKLYFYNMNASLQWDTKYELTLQLPSSWNRISAMKMPWQRGAIAIEDKNRVIRFYYLDDNLSWQTDETATFVLPKDIDDYVMMGAMDIAIVSGNKLGVYQLGFDGEWNFQDDMVLVLPENFDAVMAYEPGTIAVLTGNSIDFYEADFMNRYWVFDDTMSFFVLK